MKRLKEVLLEAIESVDLPMNDEIIEVINFIKTNYDGDATQMRLKEFGPKRTSGFYIRPEKNEEGKYVVDFKGFMKVKNLQIKSLKGAPKKVRVSFQCQSCGVQFTEDDIKKVSKVRNEAYYI